MANSVGRQHGRLPGEGYTAFPLQHREVDFPFLVFQKAEGKSLNITNKQILVTCNEFLLSINWHIRVWKSATWNYATTVYNMWKLQYDRYTSQNSGRSKSLYLCHCHKLMYCNAGCFSLASLFGGYHCTVLKRNHTHKYSVWALCLTSTLKDNKDRCGRTACGWSMLAFVSRFRLIEDLL